MLLSVVPDFCPFCIFMKTSNWENFVTANILIAVILKLTVTRHNDIQVGAEQTDTFQMVIDNIWKQEKICETVYKYVQVHYLLPTNYKLIF